MPSLLNFWWTRLWSSGLTLFSRHSTTELFFLRYIGGVFGGNIKPTPFLCLVLKMLQIQPEKDIVIEFIKNEDFKYVRALGAYYLRLTGTALDCYKYLEPLLNDYRKIRSQKRDGNFELTHMDEFIDSLLHDERVCDVQCPRYDLLAIDSCKLLPCYRIQKRQILEECNDLEPRTSLLEGDLMEEGSSDEEPEDKEEEPPRKRDRRDRSDSRERRRSRSRSRERRRSRSRDRRERRRSRSGGRGGRDRSEERRRERKRESKREKRERSRSKERAGESKAERDRRTGGGGGGGGGGKDELSIEETNKLRAELGLKPLKQ